MGQLLYFLGALPTAGALIFGAVIFFGGIAALGEIRYHIMKHFKKLNK